MQLFDVETNLKKPKPLTSKKMENLDRPEKAKYWLVIVGISAIIVFAMLGLV